MNRIIFSALLLTACAQTPIRTYPERVESARPPNHFVALVNSPAEIRREHHRLGRVEGFGWNGAQAAEAAREGARRMGGDVISGCAASQGEQGWRLNCEVFRFGKPGEVDDLSRRVVTGEVVSATAARYREPVRPGSEIRYE